MAKAVVFAFLVSQVLGTYSGSTSNLQYAKDGLSMKYIKYGKQFCLKDPKQCEILVRSDLKWINEQGFPMSICENCRTNDHGDFDQCLAYQYAFWEDGNDERMPCTIQLYSSFRVENGSENISSNPGKRLSAAVCVSSSCPTSLLENLKTSKFENIESVLAENFEKKLFRSEGISKSFIALCTITFGVVTLATFATVYDQFKPDSNVNELLMSFSLKKRITNLISLDQTADSISCLHGIRAISVIFIIYLHAYGFRFLTPFRDDRIFKEFLKTPMATFTGLLGFFVEPFFVMSGMLFTRSMLKALDTGNFKLFKTLFQRYMRLTPLIAFVLLISQSLGFFLNDGNAPSTYLDYSVIPCEKFWWSTLLHLQVYTNPQEMCMHTTWYVSVDWQMTAFVAPALIYLLWKFDEIAKTFINILIITSSMYCVKLFYDLQIYIDDMASFTANFNDFYEYIYYPTHIRGTAYLVGVLLGYRLHLQKKSTKVAFKMGVWIFSVMPLSIYLLSIVFKNFSHIKENQLIFDSVGHGLIRTGIAILVAWIIFKCHRSRSGFLNSFLSSKFWMPIAKLSFCLYIISPVIQYNSFCSREHPTNLDFLLMLFNFTKDFLLSTVAAILLNIFIEEPFSEAFKVLSRKWMI